jgi:hypothetical protein
MQGPQGESGAQGPQGESGAQGPQGETGETGETGPVENLAPAAKGLIPAIVFNDDGLKAGTTAMWAYGSSVTAAVGDLTGFFYDEDVLEYTGTVGTQAAGALMTAVAAMESADMPGMFSVTLTGGDLSATEADRYTAEVGMSYRSTMVEIMATDPGDVWTTQMFYVRRNRAPVIRQTAPLAETGRRDNGRYGGENDPDPIVVGTAGDHKTLKIDTGDAFFFDDDQLTVTAEVDNPAYATVTVAGDVITLTGLKGTEGTVEGTADSTRILLRVTDTGGLKSEQFEYDLMVDTGPAVKAQPDDVKFTLEAAGVNVYVVDIDRFFTFPTVNNEGVEYTATSSKVSVATVTSPLSDTTVTDQGGVGPDLAIQIESIGETIIKLTVTEDEADDNPRVAATAAYGDPRQTASVEFKVTVVAE